VNLKPKHPGGRPTKYDPKFHPKDFIEQSKNGKTLAQIALTWDLNRDTIHEWKKKHPKFSDAVKKGRQFCEAWYMNLGLAAMLGQAKSDGKPINVNLGYFCWLTKNMFHWSDKIESKNQNENKGEPQVIILPSNGRELKPSK
jgi:hypothetical protein